MHSSKLPAFSGCCHIQFLRGEAAHAADTARMLAMMQPTAEPLRIPSERANWLLWLLVPLLLLAGLTTCKPSQTAGHHEEHAAPAAGHFNRHGWSWNDNDND